MPNYDWAINNKHRAIDMICPVRQSENEYQAKLEQMDALETAVESKVDDWMGDDSEEGKARLYDAFSELDNAGDLLAQIAILSIPCGHISNVTMSKAHLLGQAAIDINEALEKKLAEWAEAELTS